MKGELVISTVTLKQQDSHWYGQMFVMDRVALKTSSKVTLKCIYILFVSQKRNFDDAFSLLHFEYFTKKNLFDKGASMKNDATIYLFFYSEPIILYVQYDPEFLRVKYKSRK